MKKFLLIIISVLVTISNFYLVNAKPLAAYRVDNLWYIVDEEGKAIFNPINLKLVAGYSEGFYKVLVEADSTSFWGFMNDKGEVAVPMCDEIKIGRAHV